MLGTASFIGSLWKHHCVTVGIRNLAIKILPRFGRRILESPVTVGDRLLHSQHITSLLDSVRDATLMLCGKACVFSRKDLTCLGDETGK